MTLTRKAIKIEKLTYTYPGQVSPALREINLEIEYGEIAVIVGSTGCGKSTLCLLLNGYIPNSIGGEMKGRVLVAGLDTRKHAISTLAQKVGIVFQIPETQLFCATVLSELTFGPENLSFPADEILKRVEWAKKAVGLEGFEKRNPVRLSEGEKQKVALAATLSVKPEILVLDEPTSELDPKETDEIFSLIGKLNEEYNVTIILTEHKEQAIELADKLILMKNGEIICQGEPHKVLSNRRKVKEACIRIPQPTQLYYRLHDYGINLGRVPIKIDESYELLKNFLLYKRE
ncbi:MAG: ATP-binding cassette domain-containing protein [Candidatus Aenigmarchaeota archaeon]|nr:ATP-binding cassette domain-containing protein [Candidatus Aenigmarchaeota archaeon]